MCLLSMHCEIKRAYLPDLTRKFEIYDYGYLKTIQYIGGPSN